MPKIVDHSKRKIKIAEATWKVIVEEGLENATVRKVAKAAGVSPGSLRYYFPSQSELLLFSMELVSDRVKQRFRNKKYTGSPLEVLTEMISELLPTDEEKRVEMEVWLVFNSKTLVDPKLRELGNRVYLEMRESVKYLIAQLEQQGMLKKDVDPEMEVHRLLALIDGAAVHHLLHPNDFTLEQMVKTVKYHLLSICEFEF